MSHVSFNFPSRLKSELIVHHTAIITLQKLHLRLLTSIIITLNPAIEPHEFDLIF